MRIIQCIISIVLNISIIKERKIVNNFKKAVKNIIYEKVLKQDLEDELLIVSLW